ncbi:transcriptional regulator [Streptomyces sp. NBC_00083]|uniref:transcriptional regulator n=1 Tax=Streptomyces sp. NBC_00083 TaxID=2975647 RepID=UPI00224D4DA6|nr:transcriptional regulator [Streptomyces sp. NBC_00083]MCX5387232.1 transcriptional regulator [Streptomyces sp. NBC_00083]
MAPPTDERQLSPMLSRLVAERATGALLRDSGTLYLVDGQVVHAESPAAPGIDVLLTVSGRLRPEGWQWAIDQAGARGAVGRFLVDSGQVTGGELELCHLGALFDAAFFTLSPGSGPTRFRYGVAHWIGPVRPVPACSVAREAARRRELLFRLWPHPEVDTAPVVTTPGLGGAPVTARQRALLALADGVRTPQDIARLLGRPAFHTLVDVRRLAACGAIETSLAAPPRQDVPPPVALALASTEAESVADVALLRRLRDGLEATL